MPVNQSAKGGSPNPGAGLQLSDDFPPHSYAQWRSAVEQGLKGQLFDSLSTVTLEGYESKPVYCPEDHDRANGLPGQSPYLRGAHALGYRTHPWRILSRIGGSDPVRANEHALHELAQGCAGIDIETSEGPERKEMAEPHGRRGASGGVAINSSSDLEQILRGVDPGECEVTLRCSDDTHSLAAHYFAYLDRGGFRLEGLKGGFTADPLGALVQQGAIQASLEQRYQEMASLVRWCRERAPGLGCIRVSSLPYHDASASAVQELGFALAAGAEYLRELLARGLSADEAACRISFSFPLGTRFFTEVAKLRAARVLWDQVTDAFGCSPEARAMVIHAQTSSWNVSSLDPQTNILRATVEAFAAVTGGADTLTILPYDELLGEPDEQSRRLCRNTPLILRDESFLAKVVDPAGGAWYVEHLSAALGREAWRLFQQVEGLGGMTEAVRRGYPQQEVTRLALKRSGRIARRSEPFIGASKYANLGELPLQRDQVEWSQILEGRREALAAALAAADQEQVEQALGRLRAQAGGGSEQMDAAIGAARAGATTPQLSDALRGDGEPDSSVALGIHRGAESFEELRRAAEAHLRRVGQRPRAYLAPWGPPAEHRVCVEFATEFLEAGGFEAIRGVPATTGEQAATNALADPARLVVLCASREQIPEMVTEVGPRLKGRTLAVAGPPPTDFVATWTSMVEEFIHARADVVLVLTRLLRAMEVVS